LYVETVSADITFNCM